MKLEILDAAGKVVRSFSSEGGRRGRDRARRRRRGSGLPSTLPTKVGMNRFVWDLRYPARPPSSGGDMQGGGSGGGPLVAPGSFKARLTAGGVTKTEPFTVRIDPRVAKDGVTVADLAEQTKFALKVRDALAEARQLSQRVRQAHGRQARRSGEAPGREESPDDEERACTRIRCSSISCRTSAASIGQADQKVGASAYERFNELMKEWASLKAEAEAALR